MNMTHELIATAEAVLLYTRYKLAAALNIITIMLTSRRTPLLYVAGNCG